MSESANEYSDFLTMQLSSRDNVAISSNFKNLINTMVKTYGLLGDRPTTEEEEVLFNDSQWCFSLQGDMTDSIVGDPILMRFLMLVSLPTVPGFFMYCMSQTPNKERLDVFRQMLADAVKDFVSCGAIGGRPSRTIEEVRFQNCVHFVAEMGSKYLMNDISWGEVISGNMHCPDIQQMTTLEISIYVD